MRPPKKHVLDHFRQDSWRVRLAVLVIDTIGRLLLAVRLGSGSLAVIYQIKKFSF